MPADLEAFLTVASTPGIGAVWVPIERATTWLIERNKRVFFVQAEASSYGLQCYSASREINGETFHYLKFERTKPCPKIMPAPHLSATETEPSISEIG